MSAPRWEREGPPPSIDELRKFLDANPDMAEAARVLLAALRAARR